MKVNIIIGEADLNWILGRLAKELSARNGWTINKEGADIDYIIPYVMYRRSKAPIKVSLYTHLEETDEHKRKLWEESQEVCNGAILLSVNHKVEHPGYLRVIHLGTDLRRKIEFGVAGKVHRSGRKGEHLVRKMVEEGYRVSSLGAGWPCISAETGASEISRKRFYDSIDYLVITATNEGGPVPFLDALAYGAPIIAPNVGWCWDYPCIHYDKGSWESLKEVLDKITKPRTWQDVAADTKAFMEKIYERRA